jgi:hypothetical protein
MPEILRCAYDSNMGSNNGLLVVHFTIVFSVTKLYSVDERVRNEW